MHQPLFSPFYNAFRFYNAIFIYFFNCFLLTASFFHCFLTANFLDAFVSNRFFSTHFVCKPHLVTCAFAYIFLKRYFVSAL